MRPLYLGLSSLLVLQLLLTTGLFWNSSASQRPLEPQILLTLEKNSIDKIIIHGEDENATLTKNNNEWSLLELQGLPVNQSKLDAALNTLIELKTQWPVTTTRASHERFDVAEEKFQRKLEFYQNDKKQAELLLGSSPGFRKTHIRKPDNDNVYALTLNTFDYPTNNEAWLDKSLLAIKEIKEIKGSDYVIQKSGDTWVFSDDIKDGNKDITLDEEKAKQLDRTLINLRISKVSQDTIDFTVDETITIETNGINTYQFQLVKKDDKHYIKRNDRDTVFTLAQSQYERIADIKLAELTLGKTEDSGSSDNAATTENTNATE